MSIKPIEKKSINDEVFEQIKKQILTGDWSSGKKIPGEMELTKLFGVSRVSVRDAIHRLIGMGVLTVKRGDGTYVTEILPKDYFNSLLPFLMIEGDNLLDVLEFRSVIEVQSAGIAALRVTTEDISRLSDIISRMEKEKGNIYEFAKEDLNFHTAIALATKNRIIIRVNAIIHDLLEVAMQEIINAAGFEGGLYFHKKILDALKEGNSQKSMEIMKEHIEGTIINMKKVRGEV